jgi:hypothetical protein
MDAVVVAAAADDPRVHLDRPTFRNGHGAARRSAILLP